MVSRCFRRFRDTLHEFFLADSPLRTRIAGMNHFLADAAVGAANADVLVGTAEAAHRMALKMRKDEQRVVIQHVRAHRHFREPFAALDWQHRRALFIHDIDRRKIPAVDSQRLAVFGRRIARALIIGIRFDNIGFRQFLCYKRLDPRTRDDVRAVRLARMQLDADFARHILRNGIVRLEQAGRRKIPRKIYDSLTALTLGRCYIMVAALCRLRCCRSICRLCQ